MKIYYNLITAIFLLGVIDYVEDDIAQVEMYSDEYGTVNYSLPVEIFPCTIKEGDMFYFEYADGITEIRCGEPEE